jgi:PhoPQ-activated pathogenicity-related protein
MNDRDWSGWMVAIADDNGQSVDSIPIAKVDTEQFLRYRTPA